MDSVKVVITSFVVLVLLLLLLLLLSPLLFLSCFRGSAPARVGASREPPATLAKTEPYYEYSSTKNANIKTTWYKITVHKT